MKAITRNLVLFVLFGAALVLILSVPDEESSYFFIALALTKVGGVGCMALFFGLLKRWHREGKLEYIEKFNLLEDE